MNSYELSRAWFDWSFENPEKISPNHSALYFFAMEHCNRLGWRQKFGFPTEMAKDAIGIKSYTTYIKTLNDLVDFGFIEMVERSKNQYSSNIIALTYFDKARGKALDKAIAKHVVKQVESTCESIVSINKPITNNIITINNIETRKLKFSQSLIPFVSVYGKDMVRNFCDYWTEPNKSNTKFKQELQKTWDTSRRLKSWNNNNFNNKGNGKSKIANTEQFKQIIEAIDTDGVRR